MDWQQTFNPIEMAHSKWYMTILNQIEAGDSAMAVRYYYGEPYYVEKRDEDIWRTAKIVDSRVELLSVQQKIPQ